MQSKDDIYLQIKEVLMEMFEIDERLIVPTARLYQDLDLDSIDAIDLVVRLQKLTEKKILPEQFKSIRTVEDMIEVVYQLLQEKS